MGSGMEHLIGNKVAKTAAMKRDIDVNIDPDGGVFSVKKATDCG